MEKSRLRQNSRGYESQVNRTYDTLNGYIYQKKRELITSGVDDVGFKTGLKKSRKGSIVDHPNRERSLSNKPSIPSLNMDKVREWVAKCEAYERKKQLEEDLKIQQNKDKNDPNNEGSSTQTPRADPSAVVQKLKKKSFKDAQGKSSLLNNHKVHKFPDSSQSCRDDGYKDYNHIYEDSSTENAKEYEEAGIFLQ